MDFSVNCCFIARVNVVHAIMFDRFVWFMLMCLKSRVEGSLTTRTSLSQAMHISSQESHFQGLQAAMPSFMILFCGLRHLSNHTLPVGVE